jgi:transcription-repair coupling factor (superfamily II helicase)
MRDLEIRGAGEILGKKQSGVVSQIGLALYSKLLAQTVSEMKEQGTPIFNPPPIDMDFHLLIPKTYINSPQIRIQFYQRFFMASDEYTLSKLMDEVRDRFGEIPDEIHLLGEYLKARVNAAYLPISAISVKGKYTSIVFRGEKAPSLYDISRGAVKQDIVAGFDLNPNLILRLYRAEDNIDSLRILNRGISDLKRFFLPPPPVPS